ncbi:hypothetical protein GWK48_10570 [Metallosphaera tengchongensis]|uniref:CRISPR type III-associated protein domain-containing protein n=1 Tax=Metallosphaera tengchongensis TaxID=1532350 RepID=A0A6N0P1J6_9CREN|nr:hypothetical protein GWK48_10570 [Metallosphaera tengchongensis]
MQRNNYTPRTFKGLEGFLGIKLTVVSDYLHIGSGEVSYETKGQVKREDLEKLLEQALRNGVPDVSSYFSERVHSMTKYSDGRPVIPGSTMKGLVRSRLELSIPGSCFIVDRNSTNSSSRYVNIFHPSRKPKDEFKPLQMTKVCPVCDLLGNMSLSSKVSFSDLTPEKEKVPIEFVKDEGESYECVKKDATFVGTVTFKGLKDYELGMLVYGLGFRIKGNQLDSKVMLMGRFKFSKKSFGRVKFSLVNQGIVPNTDVKGALQKFINAYRPLDFEEDWK